MATENDVRFSIPLYTIPQAARYVRVPESTYYKWVKGYRASPVAGGADSARIAEPVIASIPPEKRGWPSVPFVGLAESMVLAAFRKSGVSLQHIRRVIDVLSNEVGLEYALASERLYSDGAAILFDYTQHRGLEADETEELQGLTRVVDGQRVFADVVRGYLERIVYANDGWAGSLMLPVGDRPLLSVRPDQAGGTPLFVRGGAPLEQVLARWQAGERIAELAQDFEVPPEDLEDALRSALPAAA